MYLNLHDLWEKVIRPKELNSGELVNEDEFFPALNEICKFYEQSDLLPSKSAGSLTAYVRSNIEPQAMFFTGRSFCKGLAAIVKQGACKSAWRGIIDNYFCNSDHASLMFDEIERQVVKTSFAGGAAVINLEQEVWFF